MTSQEIADLRLAGYHAAKAGVPLVGNESAEYRDGHSDARTALEKACAGMAAAAATLPKAAPFKRCRPSFGPTNNGADREHSTYWGRP